MAEKIDFKKTMKELYAPKTKGLHIIEVPKMQFLMVDGIGNPNKSPQYPLAIEALYSLSYGIKFALKRDGHDYSIPPLEGLWWMEDMREFSVATKDRWQWTMMIMQPEWASAGLVEKVRERVKKKKANALIEQARFSRYAEGLAVQVLYTGAYADEAPVIAEMHEFIGSNGYQPNGKHHEIYLGDARKTPPERLQTILRQPIRAAG